jgi:hypothetical protein
LLGNGSLNVSVLKQWLSSLDMMTATDTHATTLEVSDAVFSVWSVPRLSNEDQLELSVSQSREGLCNQMRIEKLVAEAMSISRTRKKGNVRCWKPLPSNAVNTMTENIILCVIVFCKV